MYLKKSIICIKLRDSAARVRHIHWLQKQLDAGRVVTEITAAKKLEEIER